MSARGIQKNIKRSSREYIRDAFEVLANEKHFLKTRSQ